MCLVGVQHERAQAGALREDEELKQGNQQREKASASDKANPKMQYGRSFADILG